MRNHYRGHKLSLWLNLIPQLHTPGELDELSMKHHIFPESDAKNYDGIVRAQSLEKPVYIKPITLKTDVNIVPTKAMAAATTPAPLTGTLVRFRPTKEISLLIAKCICYCRLPVQYDDSADVSSNEAAAQRKAK